MQKLSWMLLNNDWHLIIFLLDLDNGEEFRNKVMENYLKRK